MKSKLGKMVCQAAPPVTSMSPEQLPSGAAGGLIMPPVMADPLPNSDKEEPRKSGSSGGVSCGGLLEVVGIFWCVIVLMV